MEEEELNESERIKKPKTPQLEEAVRIRSPPRTLIQLSPKQQFVFARCRGVNQGDILKRHSQRFMVVGDVPPGKDIRRLDCERVGNEREKLAESLYQFVQDPEPDELMHSEKNQTWTLLVGFKEDMTELEYSYLLTAYRYESLQSDVKPWLIDAMFSKTRFSESEVRKLRGSHPVVTYGFTRWSKTGYLRYHILTACPYSKE